jgi:hypothetical protein
MMRFELSRTLMNDGLADILLHFIHMAVGPLLI